MRKRILSLLLVMTLLMPMWVFPVEVTARNGTDAHDIQWSFFKEQPTEAGGGSLPRTNYPLIAAAPAGRTGNALQMDRLSYVTDMRVSNLPTSGILEIEYDVFIKNTDATAPALPAAVRINMGFSLLGVNTAGNNVYASRLFVTYSNTRQDMAIRAPLDTLANAQPFNDARMATFFPDNWLNIRVVHDLDSRTYEIFLNNQDITRRNDSGASLLTIPATAVSYAGLRINGTVTATNLGGTAAARWPIFINNIIFRAGADITSLDIIAEEDFSGYQLGVFNPSGSTDPVVPPRPAPPVVDAGGPTGVVLFEDFSAFSTGNFSSTPTTGGSWTVLSNRGEPPRIASVTGPDGSPVNALRFVSHFNNLQPPGSHTTTLNVDGLAGLTQGTIEFKFDYFTPHPNLPAGPGVVNGLPTAGGFLNTQFQLWGTNAAGAGLQSARIFATWNSGRGFIGLRAPRAGMVENGDVLDNIFPARNDADHSTESRFDAGEWATIRLVFDLDAQTFRAFLTSGAHTGVRMERDVTPANPPTLNMLHAFTGLRIDRGLNSGNNGENPWPAYITNMQVSVTRPDPPTVLFIEDFADLDDWDIVSGGIWTAYEYSLRLTNPANDTPVGNLIVHNSSVSDGFTMIADALTRNDDFGVVFGYTDANNFYMAYFNTNPELSAVYRVRNGVAEVIAPLSGAIVAYRWHRITVSDFEGNIIILLDGNQVATFRAAQGVDGHIGFGSQNSEAIFINMLVTDSGIRPNVSQPVPTPVRGNLLVNPDFENGDIHGAASGFPRSWTPGIGADNIILGGPMENFYALMGPGAARASQEFTIGDFVPGNEYRMTIWGSGASFTMGVNIFDANGILIAQPMVVTRNTSIWTEHSYVFTIPANAYRIEYFLSLNHVTGSVMVDGAALVSLAVVTPPVLPPFLLTLPPNTLYVTQHYRQDSSVGVFNTINAAYLAAQPGYTIIVADGIYTAESEFAVRPGISGRGILTLDRNNITIRAENRHGAVIDAQLFQPARTGISIRGDNNTIDGFVIINARGSGIHIGGAQSPSSNNRILNNIIAYNGSTPSVHGGQDGIFTSSSSSGTIIAGNWIHSNGRIFDPRMATLDHGIYSCGRDELIINNVIENNAGYGIHMAGPTGITGTRIFNNTIVRNGCAGIMIWSSSGYIRDLEVKNNIFANNGITTVRNSIRDRFGVVFYTGLNPAVVFGDISIINNLFHDADYTIHMGFTDGIVGLVIEDVIVGNPGFVQGSTPRAIGENSAAVGTGIVWDFDTVDPRAEEFLRIDYDGKTRTGHDIGAYGFVESVTGVTIDQNDFSLVVADTYQLTVTIVPANAINRAVSWTSSGNDIASVDANGMVTAIAPGSVTITVTTADGGFTDSVIITVTEVNRSALHEAIAEAEALVQANYTQATWVQIVLTLPAARATRDNAGATQAQVDEATQRLVNAINGLVPVPVAPVVDRTALIAAITDAEALVQANYTQATWVQIVLTLPAARATRDNAGATQAQVDTAATNLRTAINGLQPAQVVPVVDRTALIAAIAQAEALVQANYTQASWIQIVLTLPAARATRDNAGATQAQVDLATQRLVDAINGLVPR